MTFGKSISLYLIDGDSSGRVTCELFNRTGKAYKIPRARLKESRDYGELYKPGVYFLLGRDPTDPQKTSVYVGEAEEVYERLKQHSDKDFNDVIVFVSKDDNLNKAHIKYLEFTAVEAIRRAARATLQNGNTPNRPVISVPDQAVMTEFFQNLDLVIGTLGYKLFEPLLAPAPSTIVVPAQNTPVPTDSKRFIEYFIKTSRGADAVAVFTDEGLVVRKGSRAAPSEVPSTPAWVKMARQELQATEVLVKEANGEIRFSADYLFSSPSAAAAVVMGRSANGPQEWKDQNGISLAQA